MVKKKKVDKREWTAANEDKFKPLNHIAEYQNHYDGNFLIIDETRAAF